jgi:hypothetical protein
VSSQSGVPNSAGTQWPKGVSGNPGGRYVTRAERRKNELYDALLRDLGGDEALSVMDKTLLAQACRLLAQSEMSRSFRDAVRLSNAANRTLGSLRDRRRPKDIVPFDMDRYLASNDSAKPVDSFGGGAGYGTAAANNNAPRKRGRPPRRPSTSDGDR